MDVRTIGCEKSCGPQPAACGSIRPTLVRFQSRINAAQTADELFAIVDDSIECGLIGPVHEMLDLKRLPGADGLILEHYKRLTAISRGDLDA